MSGTKTCGKCGAEMLEEAAGGLCPRCLMALNFDSRTMPEDEAPPKAAALSPEEMKERFPQFDILECLGRGGMGVVYKARQKTLDRMVAIKVLAGEWRGEPGFALRFEKEAKTLAQMNHPNIVTVHDFGEIEGLYYIVMEFVDGVNLRDVLKEGALPPEQALAIVPPICDALQYAHDKGVVHRDIKPENLLLDRGGRIKIADFGIASLIGAEGESAGTPPYMAPEQSGAASGVDSRADIYALGVVLYEMLTGERPNKELVAPSKKVQIDVRLDEIVLRALEKTPALRYQTAGEFRTVLETVVQPPQSPGGSHHSAFIKSDRARVTWQDSSTASMVAPISGTIELFNDKLVVTSGAVRKEIPLASIQTLQEAVPPAWWSPGGHRYLAVEYDDGAGRKRIAFQAGAAAFRFVGDTKLIVAEWLSAIQRAVNSAVGLQIETSPGIIRLPLAVTPISLLWLLLLVPLCVPFLDAIASGAPMSIAEILLAGLSMMLFPLLILSGVLIVRKVSLGKNPLSPTVGEPPDPAAKMVESETHARFSRTAIVGACWLAFIPLHFLFPLIIPPDWQHNALVELLAMLQALLFWTAPLGVTILGWIAVSQIRHSAGRLYGMWLAVLDGLLFPLLALDALLIGLPFTALRLMPMTDAPMGMKLSLLLIPAGLVILALLIAINVLIIRRVWRAVNEDIPRVAPVESARKKTFPKAAIVGFAVLFAALMAWHLLPRYEAWKQEKLRIALQNELVDRIGTLAGGKGVTFSKLTVVYGSPEAPSKAVVSFDGLQSRLGPANEPLAEPRKLKGEIVLIWQPPNEWSASGTGDLSGLAAVWHTAQRGFPNGLPLRESTQPSSDATHPFLRVTVRVLETHTGFDTSKLLRPDSLLDDGEVKVLAVRYIRVRSGNVTGIQIPEIPRLAQGGGHILSGRTRTLYIKPTLDPGSAHVRYTLEGDVRGDSAKAGSYERLPIRSDSLQLGEWQLMESNSDGGRKQLAVISVEMEQALAQSARFIRRPGGYQLGEGSIVLTPSSDGKVTLDVTMVEGASRDTNTVPDFCKKEGWFVYIENPKRVWIFDGIRQLDLLTPGSREAAGPNIRAVCPTAVWDALPESVRKLYLESKVAVQSAAAETGEPFSFGAAHELTLPMNEDGLTHIFDLGEGQNATYDKGTEYTIDSLVRMQVPGFVIRHDMQAGRLIFYGMSGAGIELVRRPDLLGDQWNKITDREALELLQRNVMSLGGSVSMETRDILPQTCFFKTGTNLLGILQVTGFTEDKRGVKIRYKLVRNDDAKEGASTKPSAFKPIPAEAARLMEELKGLQFSPAFAGKDISSPEVMKEFQAEVAKRTAEVAKRTAAIEQLLSGTAAEPLVKQQKELMKQIAEHRKANSTGANDLSHQLQDQGKQLEAMIEAAVGGSSEKNDDPHAAPHTGGISVEVTGLVARPGKHSLPGNATLLDALAAAGGWAGDENLRAGIAETDENHFIEVTHYDLRAILEGRAINPSVPRKARITLSKAKP